MRSTADDLAGTRDEATGEDGERRDQDQGRVRRPKKPEIQLYRPGALRQKLITSTSVDDVLELATRPDHVSKPEKSRSNAKKLEKPKPDVKRPEKPKPDVNRSEKPRVDENRSEKSRSDVDKVEKKPVVSRLFGEDARGYDWGYNEKERRSVEKEKQEGRQSLEKEKRGARHTMEEREGTQSVEKEQRGGRYSSEREKNDGRQIIEKEKKERRQNTEKEKKNEKNTVREKTHDFHNDGDVREKNWARDLEKRQRKKGRELLGSHFKENYSKDRYIYPSKLRDQYENYSPGTSPTTKNMSYSSQNFDFSEQCSFKGRKGNREKFETKSPSVEVDSSNESYDDRSSHWIQERKGNRGKVLSKSPNVELDRNKNVSQMIVTADTNRYDTNRVAREEEYVANTSTEKTPNIRCNRQGQPDRRTPKKDKRKGVGKAGGKDRDGRQQQAERSFSSLRELQEQTDSSFSSSREEREQADRSSNASDRKVTRSQSNRERGHSDERDYMGWTEDDYSRERKHGGPKTDRNLDYGAHEQMTKRSGSEKTSGIERTDEKKSAAQVYHKEDRVKGGGGDARPTKPSIKERGQNERVKINKQQTDSPDMHQQQQQRKPTGRGSNKKSNVFDREQGMHSRSHSTLEYSYSSDGTGKDGQMSVSELSARVDQLTVGKPKGKTGGPMKKGRGWQETIGYGGDGTGNKKRYIHEGMMKGTWLEVQEGEQGEDGVESSVSFTESPDKSSRGSDNTGRRDQQEHMEKMTRVKSYSGSRESRKKLGGNGKNGNQQQPEGGKRDEAKIDLKLNKDGQERVVTLAKPRTDSESEEHASGRGRTPSGKEANNLASRTRKNVTPGSQDLRSKLGSQEGIARKTPEKKQSPGGWGDKNVFNESPLRSMENDKEDWGREVDQDLTWCNQGGSTRSPTWEDEKQSWRTRRNKRHSESEDTHRRVESPGHRGGLIQMPVSMSRPDPPVQEPPVSHSTSTTLPIPPKMLYNPNNPSKPVAVVPSARDLPVSRESPRDSGRGEPGGSGVSGVATPLPAFMQSGQTSEYALEGHSPKIDPSIMYSIQKGEMDINYYVSSNQLPVEFRRIMDIRHHLQGCYRQLLVSDIRLCQERNVEGSLWKTLYYVIIEKLREYITRDPSLKERSLSTLLMLVEEGQRYLQELLEALQREYGFTLEGPPEEDTPGTSGQGGLLRGRSKVAHVSAQKLLLSLGDLARYREQYNPTPNYTLAKKWYQMAQQVHPRNGRPFNQLAIIAVNQKRPLDVVYFYIRSLTASNPFMSARDSLVSMFDDMRKKYLSQQSSEITLVDSAMKGVRGKLHGSIPSGGGRGAGGEGLRQELWIRPDSGVTNKRTLAQPTQPEEEEDREEDEQLRKMPTDQLMKRFLTSYLHCHGMLFSRVGLDGFRESCTRMLREFRALLLSGSPTLATPGAVASRLSTQLLLQIMAVNMYAVANTEVKDTRVGSGYRSAAQDLALVLAQEMFGCVARVVVDLLPHHLQYQQQQQLQERNDDEEDDDDDDDDDDDEGENNVTAASPVISTTAATPAIIGQVTGDPQRLFSPTLAHFMPPLKAWCDWLLYHSAVWNPPTPAHEYSRASGGDTWESVAELATILQGLGPPDVPLTEMASTTTTAGGVDGAGAGGLVPLRLTEDTFLRGYEPLLPAHGVITYAPATAHTGRACDWARVERVRTCVCQFLCGVEPAVLLLKKTEQGDVLVPVVDTSPPDSPSAARPRLSVSGSSDVEVESESESEMSDMEEEAECDVEEDSRLASTVRLLARRKKALERKHRQQRKLQSLLEGNVTLEMEVRPRYLVPDTNCFIEHLDVVQALVAAPSYTVMVPLVVLNELDGLSRDAAVAKYGSVGHAVRVREGAAAALHYLRVTKPPSLKCVTSQGSVLSSTNFTDEIDVPDATNDDKILSCCVHFCSDSTQRRPIRVGVRRLYREVVLLTEDRNLRVKAHARDVPVRDLLDFARWAGVG